MLNLKKLISEYGIYKIYEILFFAISAFTCTKNWVATRPFGYPVVVGPVWCNTDNYFLIYFIVKLI